MELDADLVGSIYEAAAVPEQWPDVLSRLGSVVGSYGGAFVSVDRTRDVRFISTPSYAEPYGRAGALMKLHRNVRPERAFARRYYGFLADVDLCSREELEVDPIYVAALHPFGIGWTIGAPVSTPSADLSFFDFCRLKRDEPFGPAEAQILDSYKPHLSRAALLATRLELARVRTATSVLDSLGIPGAVLRANGSVMHGNQSFFGLEPSIYVRAFDRLDLGTDDRNDLLRRALLSPLAKVGSIPIPASEEGPGLVVHVIPIERSARDILSVGSHILVVTPVTAPAGPMTELLVGLFDLTPAEAAVARLIASGENLESIARANGVSRETTKAQLRSVFSKTGTHRQAELAGLLLAARPPR